MHPPKCDGCQEEDERGTALVFGSGIMKGVSFDTENLGFQSTTATTTRPQDLREHTWRKRVANRHPEAIPERRGSMIRSRQLVLSLTFAGLVALATGGCGKSGDQKAAKKALDDYAKVESVCEEAPALLKRAMEYLNQGNHRESQRLMGESRAKRREGSELGLKLYKDSPAFQSAVKAAWKAGTQKPFPEDPRRVNFCSPSISKKVRAELERRAK